MFDKKILHHYMTKHNLRDPWNVVELFEKKISKFTGSKYGISVDCCSHAIFLCLILLSFKKTILTIPENTYISVPSSIKLAGYKFKFKKIMWEGSYKIEPLDIIDSATKFEKDMYQKKTLTCLSFHHRKHLPIGRGGMILTDSKKTYNILKRLRYDGRNMNKRYTHDNFKIMGYHMYMTPEQAAFGLKLFQKNKNKKAKKISYKDYSSLKKYKKIFKL